jgi:non-ribosomal peptide synthetase component F
VDALIRASLERAQDVEAVRWSGDMDASGTQALQQWTYGALDAASAQLAGELAARGVKPGGVVGLCLPRGHEQLVALLAILRSGAVVLPLDPAYPRDLLAYMLANSAAAIVVTGPDDG